MISGQLEAMLGAPMSFFPVTETTRERICKRGVDPDQVAMLLRFAIMEDLAGGKDITSLSIFNSKHRSNATFSSRKPGTICGLDFAVALVEIVCGQEIEITRQVNDGDHVGAGAAILTVSAPTIGLLLAERTALNLICHLSGIATLTSDWVRAIDSTNAKVRDTRKTLPGLRAIQKYAVRCGGGVNHRLSLSESAMIKDNHVVAAGGVVQAIRATSKLGNSVSIEVEVDSISGLQEALSDRAEIVLLDNFAIPQLYEAVSMRNRSGKKTLLEASGGLTLDNAYSVASTGVDFIAVGELTHSPRSLDIGLDFAF